MCAVLTYSHNSSRHYHHGPHRHGPGRPGQVSAEEEQDAALHPAKTLLRPGHRRRSAEHTAQADGHEAEATGVQEKPRRFVRRGRAAVDEQSAAAGPAGPVARVWGKCDCAGPSWPQSIRVVEVRRKLRWTRLLRTAPAAAQPAPTGLWTIWHWPPETACIIIPPPYEGRASTVPRHGARHAACLDRRAEFCLDPSFAARKPSVDGAPSQPWRTRRTDATSPFCIASCSSCWRFEFGLTRFRLFIS